MTTRDAAAVAAGLTLLEQGPQPLPYRLCPPHQAAERGTVTAALRGFHGFPLARKPRPYI